MTNELIELMDENLFTGTEIKKNYEAIALRDPAKNIGDFSKAVDERIKDYTDEYGSMYTDEAMKEGIQAIIQEEEQKLTELMDNEDRELNAKREFIIEKAAKEIAASEDLTPDEITQRVYHNSLMTNDITMKLSDVTGSYQIRTILNDLLEAAKHDKQKAIALKSNMHLFMSKAKELDGYDQPIAKTAIHLANEELEQHTTTGRIKVYKALNEEMKRYGETTNSAARIAMKMAKESYKRKYNL